MTTLAMSGEGAPSDDGISEHAALHGLTGPPALPGAQLSSLSTRPGEEVTDGSEAEAARRRAAADSACAPPLVLPGEVRKLSRSLAAAARGEAFVLRLDVRGTPASGGIESRVCRTVRTLLRMAAVLTYGGGVPVVKIGQFADLRGLGREPDVDRLLDARAESAAALNLLRTMTGPRGVADLHDVHEENWEFVRSSPRAAQYAQLMRRMDRALRFMTAWGVDEAPLRTSDVFASHEAGLGDHRWPHLWREDEGGSLWDLTSHFQWRGERSGQREEAHLAPGETAANPVGLEIGPDTLPEEAAEYVRRLDPCREPGRVSLICRMGSDRVREVLPPLVEKVTASGHLVVWQCDPVSGNLYPGGSGASRGSAPTFSEHLVEESGEKVASGADAHTPGSMYGAMHQLTGAMNSDMSPLFVRVVDEVRGFIEVHKRLGSHPGGLRVEFDDRTPVGRVDAVAAAHGRPRRAREAGLGSGEAVELAFHCAEALGW